VGRGYGKDGRHAKAVKVGDQMVVFRAVSFVDRQEGFFTASTQDMGDFFISGHYALPAVHHENDPIGFRDCRTHLILYFFDKRIVTCVIKSACIH
jgi:hypothetical protein